MLTMFLLAIAYSFILFSAIESRCVPDQAIVPQPDKDDVRLDRGKCIEPNERDEDRQTRPTESEGLEMRRRMANDEFKIELMKTYRTEPNEATRDRDSKIRETTAMKNDAFERRDAKIGVMEIQRWKSEHAIRDEKITVDMKLVKNEELASKFGLSGRQFKIVDRRVVHNTILKSEDALGHQEFGRMQKKEVRNESLKTRGSKERKESKNTHSSLMEQKVFMLKGVIKYAESNNVENGLLWNEGSGPNKKIEDRLYKKLLENEVSELESVIKEGKSGLMHDGQRLGAKRETKDGKYEDTENGPTQAKASELKTKIGDKESDTMETKLVEIEGLGPKKVDETEDLENKQLELKGVIRDGESDSMKKKLTKNEELGPKALTGDGEAMKVKKRLTGINALKRARSKNGLIRDEAAKLKTEIIDGKSNITESGLVKIEGIGPKQAKEDGDLQNKQLQLKGAIRNGESDETEIELTKNGKLGPKSSTGYGKAKNVENSLTGINGLKRARSKNELIRDEAAKLKTEIIDGKSNIIESGLVKIEGIGPKQAKEDGDLQNKQLQLKGVIGNGESDGTEIELTKNGKLGPKSSTGDGKAKNVEHRLTGIERLKRERSFGDGKSNAKETLQRLQKRSESNPDSWCCLEYYFCGLGKGTGEPHWKSEAHKKNFQKKMASNADSEGSPIRRTRSSPRRAPKKKSRWGWLRGRN